MLTIALILLEEIRGSRSPDGRTKCVHGWGVLVDSELIHRSNGLDHNLMYELKCCLFKQSRDNRLKESSSLELE